MTCKFVLQKSNSNQISKVILTSNPSQRLLRTRHTAVEANADSEEKALTPEKMKKMMKKLMTKEEYAAKLGISGQIRASLKGNSQALLRLMFAPFA
ncbi:hypothetical protein JG688_00003260 [Phytophthora aleatoria]|uniref:PexRD2 WYL domain-containing protein n=1 Tax=Phytophthora aleatoria TaxID=2496075 RepID=A0A8J5J392_9STRA|nr:hypothetical protein JG688_00003260 [Phytophthora aleatoria]